MKSTLISMLIVLCVLCVIAVAPAFMTGDGGLLARFGLGVFPESKPAPQPPKNLTNVTTDKKVQVYKWRDESGIIQFTSTPPLETQQVEVVELRPNTNIVKAIEIPEQEPETSRGGPRVITVGNPYTPDGMKDLLDSSSSLADDLNQKQMEQQQLMEQILGIRK